MTGTVKLLFRPEPTACYKHIYDQEMYKWRHLIENFFCRLKEFKKVAMRAEKTDVVG